MFTMGKRIEANYSVVCMYVYVESAISNKFFYDRITFLSLQQPCRKYNSSFLLIKKKHFKKVFVLTSALKKEILLNFNCSNNTTNGCRVKTSGESPLCNLTLRFISGSDRFALRCFSLSLKSVWDSSRSSERIRALDDKISFSLGFLSL